MGIRHDQRVLRRDQVYLLPKTIDYYQEQLTRLLEAERFAEAAETLAFLLECKTDDAIAVAEWQHLYDWLVNTFGEPEPSNERPNGQPASDSDDEASERDIRKRHVAAKIAEDPAYVDKLLDIVLHGSDLEKKMTAVDQLAMADDPRIDAALIEWLEGTGLHPLLQFKVLQALRARGASGTVTLRRAGETVSVSIAETPLAAADFPEPIRSVPDMVRRALGVSEPGLAEMAGHVWQEFLECIYGTKLYRALAEMPGRASAMWAAGLHEFVILSVTGEDPEEPVLPVYKLKEKDAERVRLSRGLLLAYMRNPYGPD
jgi:hypothetical protein